MEFLRPLYSERKQREVGEVLQRLNIDVVYSWSGIMGEGGKDNCC